MKTDCIKKYETVLAHNHHKFEKLTLAIERTKFQQPKIEIYILRWMRKRFNHMVSLSHRHQRSNPTSRHQYDEGAKLDYDRFNKFISCAG